MPRATVAVVSTTPETVVEDVRRALLLAGMRERLRSGRRLTLCVDASWHRPVPGTHTQPWQLDGVLSFLRQERVPSDRIQVLVAGATDVDTSHAVLDGNHLWSLLDRYEVSLSPRGTGTSLAIEDAFGPLGTLLPQGLHVPTALRDSDLVLLPSLKTHTQLGLAGATTLLSSVLLPQVAIASRVAPAVAAELRSLLPAFGAELFVLMDGTVCGDGAGPRTVRPTIQNVLLAGADPVATDSVAARLLGWEPRHVPTLKRCADVGAGTIDSAEIRIRGESIDDINLGFETGGGWPALAQRLADSGRSPWDRLGRTVQHAVWYPMVGARWARRYRQTPWGRLQAWYRDAGTS